MQIQKIFPTLKNTFKAYRYKGREVPRLCAWFRLWLSIILLFAPLIPARIIDTPSKWVWFFSIALALSSFTNIIQEYYDTYNYISNSTEQKLIQNLLSLLNRCYNWQGQCRITLFVPECCDGKWFITPFDRTGGGTPPGFLGEKTRFNQTEGIPGKAWPIGWDGNDINKLSDSIIIANIPETLIGNNEEIKRYYISEFNLREETFNQLSDEKYKIRSYMAIGIFNNDMSLAALLVIDSKNANQFIDFDSIKRLKNTTLVEQKGVFISITEQQKTEQQKNMASQFNQKDFDQLAENIVKKENIVNNIKQLNKLTALLQERHKVSPADLQAALLPLDWTLKCLRDIMGGKEWL